MKKTLIAMAAAAVATGAMAQATISGSFDISAFNNGKVTTQDNRTAPTVSTKTSATGTQNTWTTAQIVVSATEDLGGGLKATASMATGIAGTSNFADRDTTLTLDGGFGSVRMGRFVAAGAAGFHGYTGAASTAVGSLYSVTNAGASGVRLGNMTAGNMERNANQIQYTSPNFSGITVSVNYGTNKSDKSDAPGQSLVRQSGASVTYAAGPLRVGAGTQDRKVQGTIATPLDNTTPIKGDLDWVGASYNFGVATVAASHIKRKDATTTAGVTTTNFDSKINAIGVTVPMGAYTLAASTYTGKDKVGTGSADDTKLSGHQVSVRYALSKRTTVYALMGENSIKRDTGNTATRKQTVNMVGLLHTF